MRHSQVIYLRVDTIFWLCQLYRSISNHKTNVTHKAVNMKSSGQAISICLKANYMPAPFLKFSSVMRPLNHGNNALIVLIFIIIRNNCYSLTTLSPLDCDMFISRVRIGGPFTAVPLINGTVSILKTINQDMSQLKGSDQANSMTPDTDSMTAKEIDTNWIDIVSHCLAYGQQNVTKHVFSSSEHCTMDIILQ